MDSGSRDHPPLGALTPDMLENENGIALYGCYCPKAWIESMPMRVIDIQLLRAVECGSFIVRDPLTEAEKESGCTWTYDETHDAYDTGCGEKFQMKNETPKENKMKFCPFCGKHLTEAEKKEERR